ncbi:MAG: hypothetical protein ACON4P_03390, partial [Candidatus Puniceispirillales bacterium]
SSPPRALYFSAVVSAACPAPMIKIVISDPLPPGVHPRSSGDHETAWLHGQYGTCQSQIIVSRFISKTLLRRWPMMTSGDIKFYHENGYLCLEGVIPPIPF